MNEISSRKIMSRFCLRLSLVCALLLSGCSFVKPTIDFANLAAAFPKPMVAKKLSVPLVIIHDPMAVKSAGDTSDEYPVGYSGFDLFVTRDLKAAFQAFFDDVTVVTTGTSAPGKAILVEVRVDSLRYQTNSASSAYGTAKMSFAQMDWSLGMKRSGASEFLFTHSAQVTGGKGFSRSDEVGEAYQELLGAAILQLVKAYEEKGIQEKVAALPTE